jgi:anti-anti-sigma factor
MSFDIITTKEDAVIHLEVRGFLNAHNARLLYEELKALAADPTTAHVVLDLQHVPLLDSSGLSALISGLRIIRQHGGNLALRQVSPAVKRIFQLTMVEDAFTFV